MTSAIKVPHRKTRDAGRRGTRVINTNNKYAQYIMIKQSHANHGGPRVARTAREKSVLALRSGKKSHITLQITAMAITRRFRRGWIRSSCEIAMTLRMKKIATAIRTNRRIRGWY